MIPNNQEAILKLLGRIAFKRDDIVKIITFKKGVNSNAYIRGYNACDGTRSLKDIAEIIGVKSNTLSPILKYWEEEGILYKGEDAKYKKLFPI
jgi:hypothetical protein